MSLLSSLRELVTAEQDAETNASAGVLLQRQSYRALERAGQAIRRLHVSGAPRCGLRARTLLDLALQYDADLPATRISSGDIVQVRTASSIIIEQAIVQRISKKVITVSCDELKEANMSTGFTIVIAKIGNEITFRRSRQALQDAERLPSSSPAYNVRCVLLAERPIAVPHALPTFDQISGSILSSLNERQRDAVRCAMASTDVALIHGPPGCGKTTVVVAIIEAAVRTGMSVLVCAPSNVAVDTITERLAAVVPRIRLVRTGHPARLLPSVLDHSLDELVARSEGSKLANDIRAEMRQNPGRLEYRQLRADLRAMETRAVESVVGKAQVVLSTCVGAGASDLRGRQFDLCIIDEAAQALEPHCWIPALLCKRLVLAGDHKQLAPTVKSQVVLPTMFERIHAIAPEPAVVMLEEQYRMHESIQRWSSDEFYDGRLVPSDAVRHHLLSDLPDVKKTRDTSRALVLIDTADCGFDEDDDDADESKGNKNEARLVARHVRSLLAAGVQPEQIGVLSPYNRQVGSCRDAVADACGGPVRDRIEIGTVDGFQGREKDAIIITMVRSNPDGRCGFLDDQRRTNVAVTRARRHLAVVCDTTTVSRLPFLQRFVQHLRSAADCRSAAEYDHDDDDEDEDECDECDQGADVPVVEPSARDGAGQGGKARLSAKQRRQLQRKAVAETGAPKIAERPPASTFDMEAARATIRGLRPGQEVSFPASLSSYERMEVHQFAEECGLQHGSSGADRDRYCWVRRPRRDPPVASRAPAAAAPSAQDRIQIADVLVVEDEDGNDDDEEDGVAENETRTPAAAVKPSKNKRVRKKKKKAQASAAQDADAPAAGVDEVEQQLADLNIRPGRCGHERCPRSTLTVRSICRFCHLAFCMEHALAEVHGCGRAAQAGARSQWTQQNARPTGQPPLSGTKRTYVASSLEKKLKEMSESRQGDRKPKDTGRGSRRR
ncbi:hypothetical protein PBRA_007850 [Plasmodiophora brassicae]|nr:hypothetical protein PBRA_007850 [Plasmodiophora brassicae]